MPVVEINREIKDDEAEDVTMVKRKTRKEEETKRRKEGEREIVSRIALELQTVQSLERYVEYHNKNIL
jgi:hypothetical protein